MKKKSVEEEFKTLTKGGAQRFVGWMISAAKSRPAIASEMRQFREHHQRMAIHNRFDPVFEDLRELTQTA